MKPITIHKARAINDNTAEIFAKPQKLRSLKAGKTLQGQQDAPDVKVTKAQTTETETLKPTVALETSKSETRGSEIHPIFLLVLGFALTCVATLVYILTTGQYSNLLDILIPAIVISGMFLVAMRSSLTLWPSLIILTAWAGLAALAKYNDQIIPANDWLIALPIILSLQIIAANHARSQSIMLVSLACAYAWLAVFTLGSDLTALASGTLIFTLGTAHHRLGKAWGDKGLMYSHQHTVIGWIGAMIGLMWAQHYFIPLGEFEPNTLGTAAHQSLYWILGTALGLTAIVISGIIRMRYNRLSFISFLNLCASCILLPVIAYKPVILTTIFARFTGLPALPNFGFALGAIVIALSVGLVMNGLRRKRYVDAVIGGVVICSQIGILLNPNYLTLDSFIVVMFSMIFALCFEFMIARRSIMLSPININTPNVITRP